MDKLKTNNDAGIGFPQEMIGNENLGPRLTSSHPKTVGGQHYPIGTGENESSMAWQKRVWDYPDCGKQSRNLEMYAEKKMFLKLLNF